MRISRKQLVGALCALSLCISSAQAAIIGQTIRIDWLYPNATTVFASSGNVVVTDPGIEWTPGSGLGAINVGEGSITVSNTTQGWSGAPFNGLRFTDVLGTIDAFTSFSLVSVGGSIPPIAPALSFTANELLVNFTPTGATNAANASGQVYTFAFTNRPSTAVPEPGTLGLLFVGLAGCAALGRRRRQS